MPDDPKLDVGQAMLAVTGAPTATGAAPTTPLEAAWALHAAGRAEQAQAAFEVLRTDPNWSTGANYGLGYVSLELGEADRAEAAFKAALAATPAHANSQYGLGVVAQLRDDLAGARAGYEATLRLEPGHPGATERLAELDAQEAARRVPPPPPPPPEPEAPKRPALARQPEGPGIVGVVKTLDIRKEPHSLLSREDSIYSMRVERESPDGSILAPVAVELRGPRLHGSIHEGDWIQLPPSWKSGKPARYVHNLSTGQRVSLQVFTDKIKISFKILFVVFFLVLVVIIALIAYAIITA